MEKQPINIVWFKRDLRFTDRAENYSRHISKPLLSRKSCSRLSPYLSYGNISMRMLYQYTSQHYAAFDQIVKPRNEFYITAWQDGQTGVPIVDLEASRKYASDIIWSFRKSAAVKKEGKRILV